MPIASLTCPRCGARVNKALTADDWRSDKLTAREVEPEFDEYDDGEAVASSVVYDGVQARCPRCKDTFDVYLGELPAHVREALDDLVSRDAQSDVDAERFESIGRVDGDDPIEEVVGRVAGAFASAAREFEAETDVDIPQVDMEQVISDERIEAFMSGAASRVKAKVGVNSELANDAFNQAAQYAAGWVGERRDEAPQKARSIARELMLGMRKQ